MLITKVILLIPLLSAAHAQVQQGADPYVDNEQDISAPYLVSVQPLSGGNETEACPGSLIAPDWVITAATCANRDVAFRVTAGSSTLYSFTVRLHHGFLTTNGRFDDIALIQLPYGGFDLSETVQPIRLPSYDMATKQFCSKSVSMVGSVNKGVVLQQTSRVLPNIYCAIRLLEPMRTTRICTTSFNDQRGICSGDQGAPLILLEEKNPTLIGLVTKVPQKGCENSKPAVFTRLTRYLPWIVRNSGVPIREE